MSNKVRSFKEGDRVVVTNNNLQSYGLVGTVVDGSYGYKESVYVRFESWHEQGEKTLYIHFRNLRIVEGEENMAAVSGNYRVAKVKMLQGCNTDKMYSFALFDNDVCEGNHVLVDTQYGYQIAKVMEIQSQDEYTGCAVTKEVVCKLNFKDFENRKAMRKKREELKKKMDKMVKENQETILYQAVAEKNPEMAQLLAEFQSLNNF